MGRNIEVCLTPELIHLSDLEGKLVIVTDIFRATSCMVAGMGSGVQSITPVSTIEECLALKAKGYISAGERGGEKVADFHIGNSPYEYMQEQFKAQKIAVTTTNGTLAIKRSKGAAEIIIGSFLNFRSIIEYIKLSSRDVVIHCAGWKGTFNLEDTTYAGGIIRYVSDFCSYRSDASHMACMLWEQAKRTGLLEFLLQSAHANRLKSMGIEEDLAYCCQFDEFDIIPKFSGEEIMLV